MVKYGVQVGIKLHVTVVYLETIKTTMNGDNLNGDNHDFSISLELNNTF